MKKKIIIAGLGHGGIAAATLLAKQGFDVTVYEKKKEGTLGYDWTDIFAPGALMTAGFPPAPKDKFEYKHDMTFFGPHSKRGLSQHVPKDHLEIKMERRDIYTHLITHAVESGVKIVYECEVLRPVLLGNRVVGIETANGTVYGDLIIDSCGLNSPVRSQLPSSLGIERDVARREKITIYRAFYNKANDDEVDAKFKVMLLADNITGVSWIASEDEHTDVLIGRFEAFDLDEVNRFADILRKENPRIGTELVRGGQFVEIPVRQPLAVLVADGYAAIGDSAFMTVPLIGSGIANSLKAAKMLADTVNADKNREFSAASLWDYQVKYYRELGSGFAALACAKLLLLKLTGDDVDYLFNSGMVTEHDITIGDDFTNLAMQINPDPRDLLNKAKLACKNPVLLKKLLQTGSHIGKASAVCAVMPKKWDRDKVRRWAERYKKVFAE